VCPEYRDDLAKALKLCDMAEAELPKTYAAGLALPGAFNTAGSTIFGGSQAGTYIGAQEWAISLKEEGVDLGQEGIMDEEARVMFSTAVAIMGTDEQQSMLDTKTVRVLKDESIGLEIVSIIPSDDLTREMYAHQNAITAHKIRLEPLGKLVCRTYLIADFNEYDLPKDEYPDGRLSKTEEDKQYEFWVEDRVLSECFVGMKLDAKILTLDGGITILDDVRETMCSFYKWLPNELWMLRHPKEVVIRKKEPEDEPMESNGGDGEENSKEKFADDESDEE